LISDAELLNAFEKYRASGKTLDSVANLAFGGFRDQEVAEFSGKCDEMLASRIEGGVTLDEVLSLLQSHGLDSHMRTNPVLRTLQLVSADHELRRDEFLYRRYRVLNS
jgi:hypothetical protein